MEVVRKLKNKRLLLVLVLGGCVLLMFLKFGTFSSTETLRWADTTTSLRHHESPQPSHPNTPGDITTPTSISNHGGTTIRPNSPKITRGTAATASPRGDVFLNPSDRRATPTNTNAQTMTTASLPTAQTAIPPTTPRFLQGPLTRCSDPLIDREKKQRIVIIGTGPTGLGAAHRLFELGVMNSNTQVIILEQEAIPGGLAKSLPDKRGFLWDMGGHVVFSHYKYFDKTLDDAVLKWNRLTRTAFAFMKDSDNMRKFIPYPVQHNIHLMAQENQQKCLKGLEEITLHPVNEKPRNFDEWLVKHFGEGLCEVFMRRYNKKVWTVPTSEMNAVWVGERVAVPDVEKIKAKITATEQGLPEKKDSNWGPNHYFRFPRYGGTGGVWRSVANTVPRSWIHFNNQVTGINIKNKLLYVEVSDPTHHYSLQYDTLITTAPIDTLLMLAKDSDETVSEMKTLAGQFVYSHTHVIGIGLRGQPHPRLLDKCWIYFPDSDAPFYRVTLFSKYSTDHVPQDGAAYWSLMCEAAEPLVGSNPDLWKEHYLLEATIEALVRYGFINASQVESKFHHRLEHGYPVPFLKRDELLAKIQPWLESNCIYSRGRFGGWRYEVGNQDHSLMQGVEVSDFIIRGIPEETYPNPNLVNSMKASNRFLPCMPTERSPDYEIVVAHFNENLDWLKPLADHCHIYHRGSEFAPRFEFRQWQYLPNIGQAAYTYLYHIISNYDHLANITVFVKAKKPGPQHQFCYKDLNEYIRGAKQLHFSVKAHYTNSTEWGMLSDRTIGDRGNPATITIGKLWESLYNSSHPEFYNSTRSNCFGVSRERILKHSLKFYKKAISYVGMHFDPVEALYLERLWEAIFTIF